jgi:hypothetical protein
VAVVMQALPSHTSDDAGQVYKDGQLLWQCALSVPPGDRAGLAADLAALLNRAAPRRPGRRIFGDGERHDFLRPSEAPYDGC